MDSIIGKILIIDDHSSNRIICQENLGELDGHEIFEAENGEKGLEIAAEKNPDVILLDIMMPVMDGFETLKCLKDDPALADIPVLMLTAKAETQYLVKAMELGASDYLTKPFQVEELVARTNTLLRLKKYRDQLKESVSSMMHEASLGVLSAGVAHDFLNILTGINRYKILEEQTERYKDILPPKFIKKLRSVWSTMEQCVTLGTKMCEGIKSYSSGSKQVQQVQQPLPHIMSPLNILKRQTNGIEIVQDFAEVPPISCNGGEIQQIILNFLMNSIQSLNEDWPDKARIVLRLWEKQGKVLFSLSDNGKGITPENIEKIFESHFTTKSTGTGLGLANVKKIIKEHNGKLNVESEPGIKTKFTISFPAIKDK
jgi:signal transduction histidine kinase